ncbi:hypothetical protein Tco_0738568 [Tanacetum coccineum]
MGLSSRNTSSYYVTHPSSVVDYDEEFEQDDVHNHSEDPLASAMLLLAKAITQNFSNPTNNHLRASSNTEIIEECSKLPTPKQYLRVNAITAEKELILLMVKDADLEINLILPSTAEEKICKKNDVKARSLLLMALPNEHQLTFDQYVDAQSMFAAIKARFGGNLKQLGKTQKALLKQQYENFNMNKPDFDTMGLDDLYNNFKIVEQKVKKSVGTNNDDKNLAFLTTSGASSTNTANPEVSTGNTM